MASIAQRPRGTQDLLPTDQPYWEALEAAAKDQAGRFGYQRIETPIFESTDLFVRGVGEGTDIVSKEMFTFSDRGGRSLPAPPDGCDPLPPRCFAPAFPPRPPP